jgi:hypothetical protein
VRRRVWIITAATAFGLVVAARAARADDELEAHARSKLLWDGPSLVLDPVLLPRLEGLGAAEERERTPLRLGPRTRLVLEGVHWANQDTAERQHVDVVARGWRAAARLSYDFGFLRLGASASVDHVDTRFGSGSYVDLGVSLSRTVRLSRWMTAWISLSLGRRRWQGSPPAGEADSTEAMLTVGTTFR